LPSWFEITGLLANNSRALDARNRAKIKPVISDCIEKIRW